MSKTANEIKLPEDGSLQDAVKRLQHSTTNSYLVFGYSDGKNTLGVVSEGTGGINDIPRDLFVKEDSRYVLLRIEHKIELTTAVKFAFVDWTPSSVKPLRKALLSTHKGQIKTVVQPVHVSLEATELSELDENEILNKIGAASGTKVSTTQKAATDSMKTTYQRPSVQPKSKELVPDTAKEKQVLKVKDEDAIRSAIKAVRADSDSTDWMLAGYSDIKTLEFIGSGSGGIDEMNSNLTGDRVFYGFFRVTDKYDQSTTVKFNFFTLTTPKLKPLEKAQLPTHRGFVVSLFEPYHNEFVWDKPSEVNLDTVMEKVQSTSGTRSKVVTSEYREAEEARQREYAHKREEAKKGGPSAPKEAQALHFDDEDALKRAITAVRKDPSYTWMLAALSGTTLSLVSKGGGVGATEIAQRLESDGINFGLIKLTDQIDSSTTIKFAYVKYTDPHVAPAKKGNVTTLKGFIDGLFAPYHVDIFVENSSELTEEIVQDKVASTSGSKSKVIEKPE